MGKRIGNKNEAQHRGKEERKQIKAANTAREAVKNEIAKGRYVNAVKGAAESDTSHGYA